MPRRTNAGRRQSKSFAVASGPKVPRSAFNRSFSHKTTGDHGKLLPVLADEIYPGDTIKIRPTIFARFNTLLYPIMDNVHVDFHLFAVPMRLLWDNFKYFMGEEVDPGDRDLNTYIMPVVEKPNATSADTIWDYMGIEIVSQQDINALYSRAYNLIFNEWYRSQDLTDSAVVDKDDGPDTWTDYLVRRRCRRHDYLSSALPFAQKGDAVELPLGTTAPVIADSADPVPSFEMVGPGSSVGHPYDLYHTDTSLGSVEGAGFNAATNTGTVTDFRMQWTDPGLLADLSTATAATINELRQSFQIQRMYEKDARYGTRYTESVYAHFGVVTEDARQQRPEFLGSVSFPIGIQAVPQTSETGTTPQATLAAFGTGTGTGRPIVKSFSEHCILMGILSTRADITYQQGIPRRFTRSTRFDYYTPTLAHLGEQAILSREIFADGTANDDTVWGYQERWSELRYSANQLSGHMRSDRGNTLDAWHLAEDFSSRPTLNDSFIQEPQGGIERAVATPTEPHYLMDMYFEFTHVRPMPTYSVPGLIDHF